MLVGGYQGFFLHFLGMSIEAPMEVVQKDQGFWKFLKKAPLYRNAHCIFYVLARINSIIAVVHEQKSQSHLYFELCIV